MFNIANIIYSSVYYTLFVPTYLKELCSVMEEMNDTLFLFKNTEGELFLKGKLPKVIFDVLYKYTSDIELELFPSQLIITSFEVEDTHFAYQGDRCVVYVGDEFFHEFVKLYKDFCTASFFKKLKNGGDDFI